MVYSRFKLKTRLTPPKSYERYESVNQENFLIKINAGKYNTIPYVYIKAYKTLEITNEIFTEIHSTIANNICPNR